MKHFDLGRHTRHIATRSTEAQRWFDLGLNWSFGFNQDAASPLVPGNGGADMVRASAFACCGDFRLRSAGCK